MSEKILVLGFDHDGCVGHFPETFISWFKDKLPELNYDRIIIVSMSNRQSYELDLQNRKRSKDASFLNLIAMQQHLAELTSVPVDLNRAWLADIFSNLELGTAFNLALEEEEKPIDQRNFAYRAPLDHSKLLLTYLHLHSIAAANPDSQIDYWGFDDRDEILESLASSYSKHPTLIPQSTALSLFQQWQSTAPNLRTSAPVKGQGVVDLDYRKTILHMLEMAEQAASNGMALDLSTGFIMCSEALNPDVLFAKQQKENRDKIELDRIEQSATTLLKREGCDADFIKEFSKLVQEFSPFLKELHSLPYLKLLGISTSSHQSTHLFSHYLSNAQLFRLCHILFEIAGQKDLYRYLNPLRHQILFMNNAMQSASISGDLIYIVNRDWEQYKAIFKDINEKISPLKAQALIDLPMTLETIEKIFQGTYQLEHARTHILPWAIKALRFVRHALTHLSIADLKWDEYSNLCDRLTQLAKNPVILAIFKDAEIASHVEPLFELIKNSNGTCAFDLTEADIDELVALSPIYRSQEDKLSAVEQQLCEQLDKAIENLKASSATWRSLEFTKLLNKSFTIMHEHGYGYHPNGLHQKIEILYFELLKAATHQEQIKLLDGVTTYTGELAKTYTGSVARFNIAVGRHYDVLKILKSVQLGSIPRLRLLASMILMNEFGSESLEPLLPWALEVIRLLESSIDTLYPSPKQNPEGQLIVEAIQRTKGRLLQPGQSLPQMGTEDFDTLFRSLVVKLREEENTTPKRFVIKLPVFDSSFIRSDDFERVRKNYQSMQLNKNWVDFMFKILSICPVVQNVQPVRHSQQRLGGSTNTFFASQQDIDEAKIDRSESAHKLVS